MSLILSGTDGLSDIDGSAATPAIRGTDANTGIFFPAADTIAFATAGTEDMRIDSNGIVLVGLTSALTASGASTWQQQIAGTGATGSIVARFSDNANPARFIAVKSRGTSVGTNTIVQNGDELGSVDFAAADGTSFTSAARISAFVDGAPGAGDLPTRLTFNTAADGSTSPTERMRIDSSGNVGIGTTSPRATFDVTNATNSGYGAIIEKTAVSGTPNGLFVSTGQNSASNFLIKAAIGTFASSTDAFVVDGTGALKFNSGYGSAATAYGCRAWVNFNGTGTVAILASGNVTSITDNGTGEYTVNITTAMPDANYAVGGTAWYAGDNSNPPAVMMLSRRTGSAQTTTTIAVQSWVSGSGAIDCQRVEVFVIR